MPQQLNSAVNPFALLMDPQAVFRAIESSERLERLHSRICRPLDKPLLPLLPAEEDQENSDDIHCSVDDLDLPGQAI